MLLKSHRGNISGANPSKENHPDYIIKGKRLCKFSRGNDKEKFKG